MLCNYGRKRHAIMRYATLLGELVSKPKKSPTEVGVKWRENLSDQHTNNKCNTQYADYYTSISSYLHRVTPVIFQCV